MTTTEICDRERKSAKRLANLQLSNGYKKIGIGIAVFAFVSLILNKFSFDSETLRFIARHLMLIGVLIVSIAKDKQEDEFIKKLRLQSYFFAFVFSASYSIVMPYFDYFVDVIRGIDTAHLKDSGDFMVLWMLLIIQVFYFEYLKRINK
jgi:hypothetical protein